MVVRVVTRNFENARELVTRLVRLLGGECISVRSDGEVEVQTHGPQNGVLIHTLETVEDWLGETRLESVEVCIDGHSYRVEQPEPRHQVGEST
jgi:hypothetical protein